MAKYISFVEVEPKPKTKVWAVWTNKKDVLNSEIGYIQWYGPWRCYSFFPLAEMIFEQQCLRDLADFCETQTKEHKNENTKTQQ